MNSLPLAFKKISEKDEAALVKKYWEAIYRGEEASKNFARNSGSHDYIRLENALSDRKNVIEALQAGNPFMYGVLGRSFFEPAQIKAGV